MTTTKPHSVVDAHVGSRLLELRKKMGRSQSYISDIIGVTYQQVQKYESGTSRIGPEKIKKLSTHFNVPISYFFENFNISPSQPIYSMPAGEEVTQLISLFLKLERADLRQKLLKTANKLIEQQKIG